MSDQGVNMSGLSKTLLVDIPFDVFAFAFSGPGNLEPMKNLGATNRYLNGTVAGVMNHHRSLRLRFPATAKIGQILNAVANRTMEIVLNGDASKTMLADLANAFAETPDTYRGVRIAIAPSSRMFKCWVATGTIPVGTFTPVTSLNMMYCSVKTTRELLLFTNIRTLNLTGSCKLTDISALGALSALRTLILAMCDCVTDVSALGGLHTLDLSSCEHITDVSALGRVHTLILAWCCRITDVSALGGVHTLSLEGCKSVTDVSALGGVHTLNLTNCALVTDVRALGEVHTLILHGCVLLTDVSALGGCHTLDLSYCAAVTDVSALGSLHTLWIRHCYRVENVSALSNLHTLNLQGCTKVDVSPVLGVVHTLIR